MSSRAIFDSIKRATVAVIQHAANPTPQHPFKIIGSGFCVHPAGIVLTCNHVFQAFVKDQHYKSVLKRVGEGVMVPTPISVFSVLFYGGTEGSKVFMHEAIPGEVGIVNDFDIAVFKLQRHPAFPKGFPTLEIAGYADLHEMMDVATCGYPYGDFLWDQVGSVTSSFTKGTMSAILPAQGIAREHLKGFQLDLFSAPGNSGGPIFCPNTGEVFGVLQVGPVDPKGNPILGLTTAEPVFPAFDQGLIEKIVSHASQRPAIRIGVFAWVNRRAHEIVAIADDHRNRLNAMLLSLRKMERKKTPAEIETAVLFNGARRCPLCFYLHGDLTEKHGQIAHLDDNPANYEQDNLAFLCMPHHSVYDSTTSQHKNYTLYEVKAMRNALYNAIANREHINTKGDPKITIQPLPLTATQKAQRYEAEQLFFDERTAFRSSSNIGSILSEVSNVLDGIENLCIDIGENAFGGFRRERTDRSFILTNNFAGLIVRWQQPLPPLMEDCGLCVEEYEGRLLLQAELATVVQTRRPTLEKRQLFEPELSRMREPGWRDQQFGVFIASQALGEKCFHQFIEMLENPSNSGNALAKL